ncbi:MAG: aminotransferase class I/II-fold pyridoxal phosphate-dependent enzyme [Hyphomicrobium sp.]|uniref:aminotransferase class I/II-fold pyridoxal phosphate-dependent enzyme n=1 Tax=Hyphomicrobium sp. TaxID=82 RepID=UPI001326CBB6|nr:aminotransferase class I/II-fold pyridoxal phosphate-dependent enzyme [Hyphomicrobium sp.]KAB2939929.1 MAG: aminotransferase class I/II-fold pyridoxal phosphate-dependent enzyme [Hyphomicrobium sp.]MBZ0209858.1 aminotransferase class I/II-fold pyridoxal phosphate-dependent enzyme [Hyphomicrobium sp.]
MPTDRLTSLLETKLDELRSSGRLKGIEAVTVAVLGPANGKGPRFLIEGHGNRPFLRMNSNSYLGLSFSTRVIEAEEEAVRRYGVGPGAVRFISGTWQPHVKLEARLADFHGREAAMLFSSAYATVMGVLPPLITDKTAVISDELNHNSIINAIALARPAKKLIYHHLDLDELERQLGGLSKTCSRAIIVTDGVFSMRGDHAPLDKIMRIAAEFDPLFAENVIVVADDSHGVGGFGASGRGTEEVVGGVKVDVLIGTLGKAFGVNGGYVVASQAIVDYLRETSPFYIYSNPITPSEAEAARAAVDRVDSEEGHALLAHLRAMTQRFRDGLRQLGLETVEGQHPVVPLLVRDTGRTARLVAHLRDSGILATGLAYPVVPEGEEEIRFQISADHSTADIDEALAALANFR